MTPEEINAIKARLGSISPRKMADLRSWSEACWILLTKDIPALMELTSEQISSQTHERPIEVTSEE